MISWSFLRVAHIGSQVELIWCSMLPCLQACRTRYELFE